MVKAKNGWVFHLKRNKVEMKSVIRYVTSVAVAFAILAVTSTIVADEASAAKAIERLDGKVTWDSDSKGKFVIGVELTGPLVSDSTLKELKEFKRLQTVGLGATVVTDAGLKELKGLDELQTLLLLGNEVTNDGLKNLKPLKQLRTLVLGSNKTTSAGITELKKDLPDLTVVNLNP